MLKKPYPQLVVMHQVQEAPQAIPGPPIQLIDGSNLSIVEIR